MPNPSLNPFMHPFSFASNTNKKRIFCLGGSATLGVPFEQNQNQTFPGQLSEILHTSGEEVEVINLGGASFGSDHVLALGIEALKYNPDFLLVYSGNNEFFTHMINLEKSNQDWIHQPNPTSHVTAYIQQSLFEKPTAISLEKNQKERWTELLQAMLNDPSHVDEQSHKRVDPIQDKVIKRFINNLQTLYKQAEKQNVPILFAVVPSNLYTPPALSLHTPKQISKEEWNSKLYEVDTRRDSCIVDLDSLTKQNPWNAQGWYKAGECARLHNAPSEEYFYSALNLDMLPGRPNQAMQSSLLKSSLPLVLFEATPEYFHDSCHLTQEGYRALAHNFATEVLIHWNYQQKKIQQEP